MTKIDCKTCQTYLPDLLDGQAVSQTVSAHVAECAACRTELQELQATWALLDEWTAPEPSPYFSSRLHARLREAQAAPPEGLWERLTSFLRFSTGRELRPILAGVLTVMMVLGGGTATWFFHQGAGTSVSSPTVNDLNIYDKNAQALQQMDLLDDNGSDNGDSPQT